MSSTGSWPATPTGQRRHRSQLRRKWLRFLSRERHWLMYWAAIVLFTLLVLACFVPLVQA